MIGARLIHGRMLPALGLACAASLLELGPISALLRGGAGLTAVLLAGLAYQVGNAVPRPGPLAAWPFPALVALLGAVGLAFSTLATPTWFAAIAALSWALQGTRRRLTAVPGGDLPSTVEKRAARVAGFVAASLLPLAIWLPLLGALLAASIVRSRPASPATPVRIRSVNGIEIAMVLHQAHYFSYCYAIPLLVSRAAIGGIPAMGAWFACGWISYLSAETLWRRFPPVRVFLVGHLCLAVVLAMLAAFSAVPAAATALWIASGLGGGTVYCLTALHKKSGRPHAVLERAEDGGHLLGVAVALAGVIVLRWNVAWLPAVGALWAVSAACVVAISSLKRGAPGAIAGSPLWNGDPHAGH